MALSSVSAHLSEVARLRSLHCTHCTQEESTAWKTRTRWRCAPSAPNARRGTNLHSSLVNSVPLHRTDVVANAFSQLAPIGSSLHRFQSSSAATSSGRHHSLCKASVRSTPAEWQVASNESTEAHSPSTSSEQEAKDEVEGGFCLMNEGPTSCSFRLVALTEAEANSPAVEDLLNTARFDPPDWKLIFQMDRRDLFGIWDRNSQGEDILAGIMMAVYYPRPKHESMCKLDDRNPFGWVGNVVVHSDYRSRGLARVLLSDAVHHLQTNRRCRAVMLDASIMGKHVYDKLGFQDVCSIHAMKIAPEDLRRLVQRLNKEAESSGGVPETKTNGALSSGQKIDDEETGLLGSILRDITENDFGQELLSARVAEAAAAVQPIREEDTWQAVIACDGQVFGADRALLLRQWQRQNPACAVWLPNLGTSRASEEGAGTRGREISLGGPVEGYAFAHSRRNYQYVGPIVAGNRASAGALLLAQLKEIAQQGSDKACFIYVVEPPEGPGAGSTWDEYLVWCRWLESLGFRRDISTVRQVLGEAPDNTSLQHYFAVGSLDLG